MESQKVSDQKSRANIIAESKKPGGLLPTDLVGFQKIGQDFGTGRIAKEKAAQKSIQTGGGKSKVFLRKTAG